MIRKFTEEMFMPLYGQGMSDQEIARRTDVTQVTVGRLRRAMGLPTNGKSEPKPASHIKITGSGKKNKPRQASSFVPTNEEGLYKWRCGLIDQAYAAGVKKAMGRMEQETKHKAV